MTRIPLAPKTDAFIKAADDSAQSATNVTDIATNVTAIAAVNKLNKTKLAHLVYDFAVDGGAISVISMLDSDGVVFSLPDNSIVTKSYYEVITTFTSSSDAATIGVGHAQDTDGIFAAAAISTGTALDSGIPITMIQTGAIATAAIKSSAANPIQFEIAVEAVTAGVMHVWLEYVTSQ